MKRIGKQILACMICLALFMGAVISSPSLPAEAAVKKEVKQSGEQSKKKRVLVVYFSRTGTTKKVAKKIKKMTGGTMFRIQTKKKYPSNYDKMLDMAQKEQDGNARPALKKKVKSMKKYDIILIGYPIWWGDAPMALYSFLESYDLSGKTIIPFCTSGGTGIGDSVKYIKKVCKGAKVKKGLTANDVSDKRIKKWLRKNKAIQRGEI